MDLSKLPKLSKSPPTPNATTPEPTPLATAPSQRVVYVEAAGPEAFISIAIGAILLLMNSTFLKFIVAPKPYRPFVDQTVDYAGSINFWSDLVITAFALVLIFEGLIIAFVRRPALVLVALAFTIVATLGNLAYLLMTYSTYGLPLLSAFAVVFGIYISMYEWRTYQRLRGAM